MFKKTALSLGLTVLLGLLCACNPMGSLTLNKGESNSQNTSGKTAASSESTQKNDKIGAPIAIPPSYNKTPSTLNPASNTARHNGLPTLKPMKGVNVDTLFSENIKDSDKRFNRVEDAVVDLRKEFDSYKPAIVRLAAVESDIQNLIQELEVLLQETPPTLYTTPAVNHEDVAKLKVGQLEAPPDNTPTILSGTQSNSETRDTTLKDEPYEPPPEPDRMVHKKPPAKQQQTTATKHYDDIVAQNLRIGEHTDKVRLVLDSNRPLKYFADLDNDEHLMIIELPSAKWVGKTSQSLSTSKLIESYSIDPINGGKGSMIILSLKKDTSIIKEGALSPDSSSPHHRIYLDLKQ